jgi:hypothetical protein
MADDKGATRTARGASKELADLESIDTGSMEWEATRFPKLHIKTLGFRKGEGFTSIGRMLPGGHNFPHAHGFRQVRYVLEGEFVINGKTYGPGSLIEFPPFARYETYSPKGGVWFQVQFWDPVTGAGPTDPHGFSYGKEGDSEGDGR